MADLLAIVSHDPTVPVEANRLERLVADYEALRGRASTRKEASTTWARACVLSHTSPDTVGTVADGDGWTAWAGVPSAANRIAGPPAEIDGQFAMARLHPEGKTMSVATDALGMKPLYVAISANRTYASTSVLALARHLRAAPSAEGVETFLHTGLQFGLRTAWQGIERLGPAQRVEISAGGRRTECYWQPEPDPALGGLTLGEAAELCIERAVAGMRNRWPERTWADLTGGFDSRLLTLLAARAGVEFTTNTVGEESSEDVRLARLVAESAGWSWKRFQLPRRWREELPDRIGEALAWSDGQLDAIPLAAVLQAHREKSVSATTLLNGGGGEEFRDHPWGHELFSAGRSRTVDYERLLAWRIMLPVDLAALKRNSAQTAAAAVREELEARAAPFADQPNTFQDDLLYAYKMTGHSGAYQAAAGAWVDLELPFYGRPLLSALISLPPRHRRFHRLMREMMQRLDPAIAALPTETGGPAGPVRLGNLPRFAPYAWRRGRRFARRARARLPRPRAASGAGIAEPTAANAALIAALRADGQLDPARMRSAALYDSERLHAMLDRAVQAPAAVDWEAVGRIVTAELALVAADSGL